MFSILLLVSALICRLLISELPLNLLQDGSLACSIDWQSSS